MADNSPIQNSSLYNHDKQEEKRQDIHQNFMGLVSTLPKERGWRGEDLHQYQGFWFPNQPLEGVITLQQCFKEAQPTDVLLVTSPKSGTTWFKALLFAIMNRDLYDYDDHPLLTTNPHVCVPFFETYAIDNATNLRPDFSLLATHMPYTCLPDSILVSGCRIVYVYRDPKDVFVSMWHFTNKNKSKELPTLILGEAFEQFCRGISVGGPFWDHVVGYWKASIEWPDRVLFTKYEDMKNDPQLHVKKLAQFIGYPFSIKEENEGIVQKILDLCSFENLSNLEVNKNGLIRLGQDQVWENKSFFRQGKIQDWKNYLTTEMVERIDEITKHKFKDLA
nr:SOT1 [Ilex asprella]